MQNKKNLQWREFGYFLEQHNQENLKWWELFLVILLPLDFNPRPVNNRVSVRWESTLTVHGYVSIGPQAEIYFLFYLFLS